MTGMHCAVCGARRRDTDVLLVTDRATGETLSVCRPSVFPLCFREVGSAERFAIAAPVPA